MTPRRPVPALAALAALAACLVLLAGDRVHAAAPTPGDAPIIPPKLVKVDKVRDGVAARRGIVHRVVVELVVGADGKPSELKVIDSAGKAWDAAVLEVLAKATFEPATRAGAPLAVRIRVPVTVGQPPAYQGRDRRIPEPVPVVDKAIAGQLIERGTRTPLAGVAVVIDKTGKTAVTDAQGRFAIRGLPRGSYRLVVPSAEHEAYEQQVKVPNLALTIRLTPDPDKRYRTVVKARTADAAQILIPVQQAREVPGSNGDPVKVIESLPGVARPAAAGPNAGQLTIRGSAPEDTKFYIDGMPLFQLYHFGNIYSVLQDEWIRDIDYRPGAFSVEYGNALGGLLGVTLADMKDDGIHGHVDVNVYHAAFLLTAPVAEDWTVGVAFRRSYVDAILGAVIPEDSAFAFSAAPAYYDYQLRVDYRPSELETFRLLVFGTDDVLKVALDGPTDGSPEVDGFGFVRRFHQVQATYTRQLSNRLSMFTGFSSSWQNFNLNIGGGRTFDLTFDPLTIRADLDYRPLDNLRMRGGWQGTLTRFKVEASLPPPIKEGQIGGQNLDDISAVETGYNLLLALWTELSWTPVEQVKIIAGVRATIWGLYYSAWAADPRLTVHFDVTDTTRVSVAGGLNHQIPQPDEYSQTFGNPALNTERAAYANIGVSQQIGDYLKIELQGYYKAFDSLVSPTEFGAAVPYNNAGSGYAAGGELLVQLNTRWVDGWLSYTLGRSVRVDQPGQKERAFSTDQTHVLALVLGVNLPSEWRIGARFRYATGNPFTPLRAAYYDSVDDVYVPTPAGPRLSERLDDFYQLDLRVDKTFRFDAWAFKLYLEVSNVTTRANTEQVGYSFDYSKRNDIVGLPIIPSFGMRATF